MPDNETQQDPLDLAADLLFQVMGGLPESSVDLKKNEAARTCLIIAQTTALIDLAKSMRVQTEVLKEIRQEMYSNRMGRRG